MIFLLSGVDCLNGTRSITARLGIFFLLKHSDMHVLNLHTRMVVRTYYDVDRCMREIY